MTTKRRKPGPPAIRASLGRRGADEKEVDPQQRIAAVLRFAAFDGPTGEIELLIEEIERGRDRK